MAIKLNSEFEIFARGSTQYEGIITEIMYRGAIIAQFNEDQGEDIFEIDIFVDHTLAGSVSKFLLSDFLEAVDEAIKLLKEYRFISLYIVSSAEIQKEELINFLQNLGASIHKEPNAPFIATFSKELQKIDIALDNKGLSSRATDEIDLLTQILGSKPQTGIMLEASSRPEAQKTSLELCCAFVEQWPCAVVVRRRFFSSQDLLELRSYDGMFW